MNPHPNSGDLAAIGLLCILASGVAAGMALRAAAFALGWL